MNSSCILLEHWRASHQGPNKWIQNANCLCIEHFDYGHIAIYISGTYGHKQTRTVRKLDTFLLKTPKSMWRAFNWKSYHQLSLPQHNLWDGPEKYILWWTTFTLRSKCWVDMSGLTLFQTYWRIYIVTHLTSHNALQSRVMPTLTRSLEPSVYFISSLEVKHLWTSRP